MAGLFTQTNKNLNPATLVPHPNQYASGQIGGVPQLGYGAVAPIGSVTSTGIDPYAGTMGSPDYKGGVGGLGSEWNVKEPSSGYTVPGLFSNLPSISVPPSKNTGSFEVPGMLDRLPRLTSNYPTGSTLPASNGSYTGVIGSLEDSLPKPTAITPPTAPITTTANNTPTTAVNNPLPAGSRGATGMALESPSFTSQERPFVANPQSFTPLTDEVNYHAINKGTAVPVRQQDGTSLLKANVFTNANMPNINAGTLTGEIEAGRLQDTRPKDRYGNFVNTGSQNGRPIDIYGNFTDYAGGAGTKSASQSDVKTTPFQEFLMREYNAAKSISDAGEGRQGYQLGDITAANAKMAHLSGLMGAAENTQATKYGTDVQAATALSGQQNILTQTGMNNQNVLQNTFNTQNLEAQRDVVKADLLNKNPQNQLAAVNVLDARRLSNLYAQIANDPNLSPQVKAGTIRSADNPITITSDGMGNIHQLDRRTGEGVWLTPPRRGLTPPVKP